MFVFVLVAVSIVCAVGHQHRQGDNVSNLQLLLPIKFVKQKAKSRSEFLAGAPGRLLPDGPYSRIPRDQFRLDENPFLLDGRNNQKTVKKDLSHGYARTLAKSLTSQLPSSSYGGLSVDLTEKCLNYILQHELSQNPKRVNTFDRNLLLNLCRQYVEYTRNSYLNGKQNRAQVGFAGSLDANNAGGFGGYVGVNAYEGNFGNTGASGLGKLVNNFGVGSQTGTTTSAGYQNTVNTNTLNDILQGLGNVGMGNVGVNGKGGYAGNAAFNGQGGVAGNYGAGGNGGQVGNLGVGGKGGVFGNLGIGGQGGFFGNVGIGTAGSQHLDLYSGNQENFLNYLFSGSQAYPANNGASVQNTPPTYVSLSQNLLQKGNNVAPELTRDPVSNADVGLVSFGSLARPAQLASVQVVNEDEGAGQTKGEDTKSGKESEQKADGKQVARNDEVEQRNRCLVGSLALGGQGGQVGNLAVSGAHLAAHVAPHAGSPCARCIHFYYMGLQPSARSGPPPTVTPVPLTLADNKQQAATSLSPEQPKTGLNKFKPIGGRRNWVVLDNHLNGKLRQYVNSRKPWLIL